MKPSILLTAIVLAGGLAACREASDEAQPVPTAPVVVKPATEHLVEEALIAYGTVEFVPSHTRSLTVQVESQLADRFVLSGALVKQGQALLRLMPSATSRLDMGKAVREASVAEADAQRAERLHAQGLATDSELRAARAAAETAAALRESFLSRIGTVTAGAASGITLRAPIAGIVDGLSAQPGDVIPAGTSVLRIADPTAVYARLGLEPQDVARVHDGDSVTLSTLSAQKPTNLARISEVDARVDPQTHLASAIAQLGAGSGLSAGSAVRARIVIDTHAQAITVPRSAVLYAADRPFVFVADAGHAYRRPVATGIGDDAQIEIITGLKAGESVVTGGNYELEDGMAIRPSATP